MAHIASGPVAAMRIPHRRRLAELTEVDRGQVENDFAAELNSFPVDCSAIEVVKAIIEPKCAGTARAAVATAETSRSRSIVVSDLYCSPHHVQPTLSASRARSPEGFELIVP